MKKIIFLLFAFSFALSMEAQTFNFTGTDTVVNTATVNIDLKVNNSYESGVYQIVVTKLSGTVAGNAILQASVDGTNYVNIDTLATTNVATQTKIFTETLVKYPWYRVAYTGTGTMSAIINGVAHFKGRL